MSGTPRSRVSRGQYGVLTIRYYWKGRQIGLATLMEGAVGSLEVDDRHGPAVLHDLERRGGSGAWASGDGAALFRKCGWTEDKPGHFVKARPA